MGGYILPALAWLAVSVYGASVIFQELQPVFAHHRLRQALGVHVPATTRVGVWGAGVGGSLAWTALLGFTAFRILS